MVNKTPGFKWKNRLASSPYENAKSEVWFEYEDKTKGIKRTTQKYYTENVSDAVDSMIYKGYLQDIQGSICFNRESASKFHKDKEHWHIWTKNLEDGTVELYSTLPPPLNDYTVMKGDLYVPLEKRIGVVVNVGSASFSYCPEEIGIVEVPYELAEGIVTRNIDGVLGVVAESRGINVDLEKILIGRVNIITDKSQGETR